MMGPMFGKPAPLPYGAWYLEAMDSHGGWISSAIDLVRFASAFDDPARSKILSSASITAMFSRPPGEAGLDPRGKPRDAYYGFGWEVRPIGNTGKANSWHTGLLDGTSTILVRRFDGLNWAVLFNTQEDAKGANLAGEIDSLVHEAADKVKKWPNIDLFE
jgi:CubicO group peptidase (beta-lactamase class C family)